jgi:hypothetical protein
MTAAIIIGAVIGAGIFLLVIALMPQKISLARQLAAFDTRPAAMPLRRAPGEKESEVTRRLGLGLAAFCKEQGWEFPALRNDLALAGKSFENFLATSALLAVFGFLIGPILLLMMTVIGVHVSFIVPIWAGIVLAVIFAMLPYVEVKQKAAQRRKDFREEIRVDELRDLAAALSLVAEDGAKVRESLTARAASLRRRELADLEGQAGERSQSMLVAQMFLVAGFLVFLVFPVIGVLLGVQGH